ncbi:hypothetical protein RXV86_02515 [Alisedimentitalea sp. MJ-SS2]|uniref:hypothetical protein n=1 Tax=Aliisedimentitalea sp. MJ-SS2 TaxID=3049795 RepID=UPI00290B2F7E|nr:hypothetical protein [Alisedimentitalea sp. MJ-SS2]MDU8926248.1 hypothetical protein [Alisedimentitalea sp. MJ-SS2]
MKYSRLAPILAIGVAVTTALTAQSVKADPAFGFGLSYVFGGGSSDVAVGARVFSDDAPRNGALSIGLDYKIGSQSLRPNIGAAYLDDDVYGDVSIGYDFGAQGIDFGLGVGGWGQF